MIDLPTSPSYRTAALFADVDGLIAAESTRHGGVSPAPFASLNLGINTDDTSAHVDENRRRFFAAIGATGLGFASSHQVHGTSVLYATEPGRFDGYDALMTDRPGLLVGVTVADCVPILLYDQANRVVAAIHAGWRGTVGQIVTQTVRAMQQQFGTEPGQCLAYVGTCIDTCSFVVGEDVAAQFATSFVQTDPVTQQACVDLKAANRQQLLDAGVPDHQIEVSTYSTVAHNHDYFSYRAERGQTGRMLAVIGLRS